MNSLISQKLKDKSMAKGLVVSLLALLLGTLAIKPSHAIDLATSPLFLSEKVAPNVVFLADDSGSMDWDLLIVTAPAQGGRMQLTGDSVSRNYSYTMCDNTNPLAYDVSGNLITGTDSTCDWDDNYSWSNGNGGVLPSEERLLAVSLTAAHTHGVWRGRFSGYNYTYYDPSYIYTPWSGYDSAGVAFANQSPIAARLDPYNATASTITTNLTSDIGWTSEGVPNVGSNGTTDLVVSNYHPAAYYTWVDTDSDGNVDATDGHTRIEIRSGSTCPIIVGLTVECPTSFPKPSTRTDCSGTTCSYDDEIRNFANWFSYYRRREASAKYAIGKVIADRAGDRMAFATINNNSNNRFPIALMNTDMSSGNKRGILDNVYATQSASSTPLRTNLRDAGRYFECVSGNLFGASGAACPILPVAEGGACQNNFTILMTDGFYNGSSPLVGNTDAGSGDFDGSPYADAFSNTLADVAMDYYERDLSGLANEVPVIPNVDNARHQHMVTFTVAFGLEGSLDRSIQPGDTAAGWAGWPNPGSADIFKIDDMWHAAFNGRGQFLSAARVGELTTSLKNMLRDISSRSGSAASAAANGGTINARTRVYKAEFESTYWSGDLTAHTINGVTGVVNIFPNWSAQTQIDSVDQDDRVIITRTQAGDTITDTVGVAFRYDDLYSKTNNADGSLATEVFQRRVLNINPLTGLVETTVDGGGNITDAEPRGNDRVEYIRGNRSLEPAVDPTLPGNSYGSSSEFRYRASALGDMVNSAPTFVGVPGPLRHPNLDEAASPFNAFRTKISGRPDVVYVGANDGMMHGFLAGVDINNNDNPDAGKEVLGYVPMSIYSDTSDFGSQLPQLTNQQYTHRYFVDGSPGTGNAFFQSSWQSAPDWHTVLVSGLGAGGQAVFALDVSDPNGNEYPSVRFQETNANNISLWEFSSNDDNRMGNVFGKPVIAKTENGKWVAIFGNGYNSANGTAALIIIFLDKAADGSITVASGNDAASPSLDNDYVVLDTGVGTIANPNGLSGVAAVDLDNNGLVDHVYAGDLEGNMWKFDLTDTSTTGSLNWEVDFNGDPLFVAEDGSATSQTQPITVRPEVVPHPDPNESGFLVMFGTGRYLATGDNTTAFNQQTFYGIWDKNVNSNSTPVDRSDLLLQSYTNDVFAGPTGPIPVRTVTDNSMTWRSGGGGGAGTYLGWMLDLTTTGERAVSDPQFITNNELRVIFTTVIPRTASAAACDDGGEGWLMELCIDNGGSCPYIDLDGDGEPEDFSGVQPGVGPLPSPIVLEGADADYKIMPGTTGQIASVKNTKDDGGDPPQGRNSWRELR